jgi:hypothetical protein
MPTFTPSLTPTFTPTPDPQLPCGSANPDGVFAYLDCDDIRRIRWEIENGSVETRAAWERILRDADTFHDTIRADASGFSGKDWLWGGGGGRYSPRNLALAYLITGQKSYALDLRNMMRTIVNNTPKRDPMAGPETGMVITPFHGGVTMQSFLLAYVAVRDTFDSGTQKLYDNYFYDQMALWEEIAGPDSWITPWSPSNVGISVDAAAAITALALPDHPQSNQLYADASRRLALRLNTSYDLDGGWTGYADSYASMLFECILLFAQTVENVKGENLYGNDFAGKSIHTLCNWFLAVMTPDGSLPAINDGVWGALEPGNLRLCASKTGDPTLTFAYERYTWGHTKAFNGLFLNYFIPFGTAAWADSSLPMTEPAWTSKLLSNSGLAIFRSGWSKEDQYLLLQFTNTKHHNHFSFGNVVLYDNGPWMLDNGYQLDGATFMGAQHERSISTLEHSTLTLDGLNQTFTGGTATFYATLEDTAFVSVRSKSYPNLTHRRTILWAEPWHQWLVIDDAGDSAGGRHTLQQRWFIRENPSSHNEEGQWIFHRDSDALILNMFSDEVASYAEISRNYNAFPDGGSARGVEMFLVPSQWPVRLATVLTSQLSGMPEVDDISYSHTQDGSLINILREGVNWSWLSPNNFPGQAQNGEMQVNGQAGYSVNSQGHLQAYGLFGGTLLTTTGLHLVKTAIPISIEINIEEGWASILADNSTKVAFYWPFQVGRIEDESGNSLEFEVEANQLTLEITPGQHKFTIQAP